MNQIGEWEKTQKERGEGRQMENRQQKNGRLEYFSKWNPFHLNPFPACYPMSFQQVLLLVQSIEHILLA